ncbi:PAS domain-containing protein [Undibacterium luofuense]|uniref:PAS domain-containing protein n=1 Tax=Undibacterium luofuense TaxID=2828733 RepID=UPI0030EB550B
MVTARISQARRSAEENSRRLGNQVRSSEARFRNLVESTRDWMWETNAEGVFTYSSNSVFQLLGVPSWEVEGRRGSDFGFAVDLERAAAGGGRPDR